MSFEDRNVPAGYTTVETVAGDFGNDGVPEFVSIITRQFDNHDRLLSEVTMNDTDFDGTGDFLAHSLTQTFDNQGNLTDSVEFEFIDFLPGVTETITLHQDFNSRGDLTHSVQSTDFASDGTVETIDTTNRTYDPRGNLTREEVLNDFDADGTADASRVLVQVFDAQSNLTSSVETLSDSSGPTLINAVTNTYDNGDLVESVSTQDQGADGVIDFTSTQSQKFDNRGDLIESVFTQDFGADGVIDFISTRTQEFNSHGNVTLAVVTSGSPDFGFQVERITQGFDAQGNVIHSVDSLDFDNDGVVDLETTVDRTFDHGNLVSQVTESGGGGFTSRTTLTQKFDQHGHLLSSVEVLDFGADGIPESINSLTQEFDAQGKLISSVQSFDTDGDGVADNVITHTFTY